MRNAALAYLTLLLMVALLLSLAVVFPAEGIRWAVGADTLEVRYPTLQGLFTFEPPRNETADSLLDRLAALDTNSALVADATVGSEAVYDTTDTGAVFLNPKGTALDSFFAALSRLEGGVADGVVRIEHYGDSQIEGDRITHFIRRALQQRFGGNGLGVVGFSDIASHMSLTRQHGGYWRRYNVFSDRHPGGRYGVGGLMWVYGGGSGADAAPRMHILAAGHPNLPQQPDTALTAEPTLPRDTASIQVPDSGTPTPRPRPATVSGGSVASCVFNMGGVGYDVARLLYGRVKKPCLVKVFARGEQVFEDSLRQGSDANLLTLNVPPGASPLRLEFTAEVSPELYGLVLDPRRGIQVDNFGIRGHSGDGLNLIPVASLREQYRLLGTRLIVLQFGGNVVPSDHITDWKFFEDAVYSQLVRLKRACPQAAILVVGVGDASKRYGGVWQTFRSVPLIRNAQRKAAQRAGVAFWDLYQAMGGENSMLAWVKRGLGAQDYAHYSTAGQRLVADLLVRLLMAEYAQWKVRQAQQLG